MQIKLNKDFTLGLNKFFVFITLYIIGTIALWIFIYENQAVYDTWVLDGIFIPVFIFIIASVVVMVLINDNRKLVVVASIFLGSLNIIPALKYPFFFGVFDGPGHFRFAEQIALIGHIPQNEFYSISYGANPASHIFLAGISLISSISINDVIKFFVPGLFALIPFIIYIIGRNFLASTTLKYTIIASSLPVIQAFSVWGTYLVFIPYLLLLSVLIFIVIPKFQNRSFFLLFALFAFAIVTSHAVTSLMFALVLLCLFFGTTIYERLRKKPFPINFGNYGYIILLFLLMLWGWWSIVGTANLEYLVNTLKSFITPSNPVIPTTFFRLPLFAQIQIFFVLNAANVVVALFTFIGLIFLVKYQRTIRPKKESHRLYIFIITIALILGLFVGAQAIANFGDFSYQRLLVYAVPLCFFPMGLALSRINLFLKRLIPKARFALIVSLLVVLAFLSLIQVYPSQSLVPTSNVLSSTLPSNEYILDLQLINTIYQKDMIQFAAKYYTGGPVIADIVTRSQSYGFSDPAFFTEIEYPSPLSSSNMTWQIYLLHTSAAGPFGEQAQYRTSSIIENTRDNAGDVIYDNGASFELYNPNYNSTAPGHIS